MSALSERQAAVEVAGSTSSTLKIGVVGCGKFGGLHTGKYATSDHVDLVGVFDTDPDRRAELAVRFGCKAETDLDKLLDQVEAVSIAAPALFHFDLARRALSAGVHTLIEKPIALDLEHADELIELSARRNLVLQVGHQERFVFDSFGIFARDVKPIALEARRVGPYTGRGGDVSVVFDLMIHDLDLMHNLMGEKVVGVSATSRSSVTEFADEVEARITLDKGCEVTMICSRIAEKLARGMRLVYPDGVIELDFVNRTLRNTTQAKLNSPFEEGSETAVLFGDPLGASINDFILAIKTGRSPRVTGQHGRRALATALEVERAIAR